MNIKNLFLSLMIIPILMLCSLNTALAKDFPTKPYENIYVVDDANILSTTDKQDIKTLGSNLEAKTKAQITVVTIDSLDGDDIDDYSNRLFNTWGIGDKELENGILFVVAVSDHKMRIEVGRGLEGTIPAMTAGRIMDKYAKPYFKNNDYPTGIINTYKAILTEITNGAGISEDSISSPDGDSIDTSPKEKLGLFATFLALSLLGKIGVIIIVFIVIMILLIILSGGSGGSSGGLYGGGSDSGGSFFSGGSSDGGGCSDGW